MSPTTEPGRALIGAAWLANLVFALTAVPAALGVDAVEDVAIAVALLLFLVAIGAFVYAFVLGLARSARGDNVAVSNLFFLQGSAPRGVRRTFLAAGLVCLAIAAATAVWAPFGVLVPMLPMGLAGMWSARFGTFPPRAVRTRAYRP